MVATPDTSTTPDVTYTREQLRDPDVISDIGDEYRPDPTAPEAPWELRDRVEKAVRAGIFVRDTSDQPVGDHDFGSGEIKPVVAEYAPLLADLRHSYQTALTVERKDEFKASIDAWASTGVITDQAERLARILEQEVGAGRISVSATTTRSRTPGAPGRPATTSNTQNLRLTGTSGDGEASLKAIRQLRAELLSGTTAEQKEAQRLFQEVEDALPKRAAGLKQEASDLAAAAKYQARQEANAQAAEARAKLAEVAAKQDKKYEAARKYLEGGFDKELLGKLEQQKADELAASSDADKAQINERFKELLIKVADRQRGRVRSVPTDPQSADAWAVDLVEEHKQRKTAFDDQVTKLGSDPTNIDAAHDAALVIDPSATKMVDLQQDLERQLAVETDPRVIAKLKRDYADNIVKARQDWVDGATTVVSQVEKDEQDKAKRYLADPRRFEPSLLRQLNFGYDEAIKTATPERATELEAGRTELILEISKRLRTPGSAVDPNTATEIELLAQHLVDQQREFNKNPRRKQFSVPVRADYATEAEWQQAKADLMDNAYDDALNLVPNADRQYELRRQLNAQLASLPANTPEAARQQIMADRESQISDAIAADTRIAVAEAKAHRPRTWTRGELEVYRRFEQQINSLPADASVDVREHLLNERETALEAARQENAALIQEASRLAIETQQKATGKEFSRETVVAADTHAEAKAEARLTQLGMEKIPFYEVKRGGFFHWSKARRGPKTVEMYYKHPTNEHVMVVDRRKRRNGELVSQSVLTTERPARRKGKGRVPAKEVLSTMQDIRAHDRASHKRGTAEAGDYFMGLKPNAAIAGGADSVLGRYGATAAQMADYRKRGGVRRKGGLWRWFTG